MKRREAKLETETLSDHATAPPSPVVIEAIEGPGAGARLELAAGTATVGTHDACDLELDDPAVSRRHATIEVLAGAVRVTDLGSRNGTVYLDARLTSARVPLGATVSMGRTTLRFLPARGAAARTSERTELGGLIGRSTAMRRLFAAMERIAPHDSTVLVRGETGTGKEAVARALHALSPRASGPFVVFDCAAVSPELVESQLFGHQRGAFTGADRARRGSLEAAEGGTFFLDEIGDLPLELQPKLLRLLESRQLQRLGDTHLRHVDARIVAATQRDLEAEVEAGRFRRDLMHRLGLTLEVPALRERRDDIAPLAEGFARELGAGAFALSRPTLAALQAHPWPGNVRELRNAVERITRLGEDPTRERRPASYLEARDEVVRLFEKDYLSSLLARHGDNVSAVARESKLSRSQLYRLLRAHRLV